MQALQTVVARNLHPCDAGVVSVTQFHSGSAWNIIPEEVVIDGTVRTLSKEVNRKVLDAARRITEGAAAMLRGSATFEAEEGLPPLVNDDALYTDAQAVAANLREISDRLAKGEGTLGHLLSSDDTAYQDLAATIATFRKLSDSIAKGEGTIGKLVSDEELYMEFKALLREGRAAVDDIRETSPVTTFTSVFFVAF